MFAIPHPQVSLGYPQVPKDLQVSSQRLSFLPPCQASQRHISSPLRPGYPTFSQVPTQMPPDCYLGPRPPPQVYFQPTPQVRLPSAPLFYPLPTLPCPRAPGRHSPGPNGRQRQLTAGRRAPSPWFTSRRACVKEGSKESFSAISSGRYFSSMLAGRRARDADARRASSGGPATPDPARAPAARSPGQAPRPGRGGAKPGGRPGDGGGTERAPAARPRSRGWPPSAPRRWLLPSGRGPRGPAAR